jgi:hypothetical protein
MEERKDVHGAERINCLAQIGPVACLSGPEDMDIRHRNGLEAPKYRIFTACTSVSNAQSIPLPARKPFIRAKAD